MKNLGYRVLLAILWCILVMASASAQDEENQSDLPQPSDTGTPGLVSTADNLNLPLVPPAPTAEPPTSGPAMPPILPNTPLVPGPASFSDLTLGGPIVQQIVHTNYKYLWKPFVSSAAGVSWHTGEFASPVQQQPELVQTYTYEETGDTLYGYSDGSFELENVSGTIWLTGYFGFVGEDKLVAIAEDEAGTSYAFYNGYFSAFTAEGDVVVGNAFTAYYYDFDEDGNLLSLTDSAGGEYDVQIDEDGLTAIWGSDGYEAYADESGAFELYDADGDLVVEGELGDGGSDEFAVFDDNADDAAVDQIAPADDDGSGDDQITPADDEVSDDGAGDGDGS